MHHRITLCSLVALSLSACTQHASPSATNKPATLKTELVGQSAGFNSRPVDGVVEAIDDAVLAAQTSGRVVRIVHDVGSKVAAGTVLLEITGSEQRAGLRSAESAVTGTRSAVTEAIAQYDRVKALYDEHIAAKSQYDNAVAARDRALAAAGAADSALTAARESVAHTEVRAPFSGIVSRRMVEVGETVEPGHPLIAIVSPKTLRVAFNVPATIADAVRNADRASVILSNGTLPLHPLIIYPEAGGDTATLRARAELPPDTGLTPGTPVRVDLPTMASEHLTVSNAAIVRRSEVTGVYIVDPQGATSLRYVRLGHENGGRTEVISGLSAGESVALDTAAAARQVAGLNP
jgi:RND family efflux transporter MFP subunit